MTSSLRRCSASLSARRSRRWCKNNSSRSEEHTSELQSQSNLVCRLLLEKKNPLVRARITDGTPELRIPLRIPVGTRYTTHFCIIGGSCGVHSPTVYIAGRRLRPLSCGPC